MLGKFLGRNKKQSPKEEKNKELIEKIEKMNLTDMRLYVNNQLNDFAVCEDGLIEVMKRLVKVDENTKKRYLSKDDMDTKIKKAFDLVIVIGANKKVSIKVTGLMQEFLKVYSKIILDYDTKHKQIYSTKLKNCIEKSIMTIGNVTEIQRRIGVLK